MPALTLLLRLAWLLIRVALWLAVLAVPLAGVWIASSLAALLNGPTWVSAAGGLLLFPIIPVLWDVWARRRAQRRDRVRQAASSFIEDLDARKRRALTLGFGDRLLLRTLALNLVFVGGLLGTRPSVATSALMARGDWFLDGVEGAVADEARRAIHALADRSATLYELAETNPYEGLSESEELVAPPPRAKEKEKEKAKKNAPAKTDADADTDTDTDTTPPKPPPAVHVIVPEGAQLRLSQGELNRVLLSSAEVALTDAPLRVVALLGDGASLSCTIQPTPGADLSLVPGPPWSVTAGETTAPCEQLVAADPTWRPTVWLAGGTFPDLKAVRARLGGNPSDKALSLHLRSTNSIKAHQWVYTDPRGVTHVLAELLIRPQQVTGVQVREPFFRITLEQAAATSLCERTQSLSGHDLYLFADGQPTRSVPIHEAVCDGVLRVPTTEAARESNWGAVPESGELHTASLDGVYPLSATPHPILGRIDEHTEQSIALLGRYFSEQLPDPTERLKAVHDWVVTHIAYDVDSLKPGKRKPQDADSVFSSGLGVCAGYSNLMVALGDAAGLRVVYLLGDSRDQDGEIAGGGHAWNAVELDGKWFLIDATWDAGHIHNGRFTFKYDTEYLLTPPDIFRISHLPKHEAWQLSDAPISRGDFTRSPQLQPAFFLQGLHLVSPTRSQVTVGHAVTVKIANPEGRTISATADPYRCRVTPGAISQIECQLPEPGTYNIALFAGPPKASSLSFVGRIRVNATGR